MSSIIIGSFIVLIISLIEAVGLTILRAGWKWSIPLTSLNYAVIIVPLLAYSLNYQGIGMINFLWNVFSTIIMFVIGIYIFREKISYMQLIGVIISLLGLGIIFMAPDSHK